MIHCVLSSENFKNVEHFIRFLSVSIIKKIENCKWSIRVFQVVYLMSSFLLILWIIKKKPVRVPDSTPLHWTRHMWRNMVPLVADQRLSSLQFILAALQMLPLQCSPATAPVLDFSGRCFMLLIFYTYSAIFARCDANRSRRLTSPSPPPKKVKLYII